MQDATTPAGIYGVYPQRHQAARRVTASVVWASWAAARL